MQYLTAYGALIDVARLVPGDAVIITAASSSVGLAAIQITNAAGAISIAATRTRAKREALLAKTFPFEKIVDAHRFMESNEQIGKIIVIVD
jgi:NADPH:quinone reductase-like Zn-dependent oxidoreductase